MLKYFSKLADGFLEKDPKALFDHFRNYGIAGAIYLFSSRFMEKIDASNDMAMLLLAGSFLGLLTGVVLFAVNFLYGGRVVSKIILGRPVDKKPFYLIRLILKLVRIRSKINFGIAKKAILMYILNFIALIVLFIYEFGIIVGTLIYLIDSGA